MGRTAIVVLALFALPLTACGTAERENDAAAVAERFHAALQSGDGQAACQELNAETASKLEQQEKKPCDEAILDLDLPKGGSVTYRLVEVRSAYARLTGGSADFLSEGPDGWKVSDAGCHPTTADKPYDCELEG